MSNQTGMHVLRATSPRFSTLPTFRYWNADTHAWGRFDEATRYPEPADLSPPVPDEGADIEWKNDLPRDLDGYPYRPDREVGEPWRVTHCCAAMVSISDGPLYCKSCYEEADLAYDTPARLGPDWDPGDGPMQFQFPPT